MSEHREWNDKTLCQPDRECLLKSEHNATVRAYRDAMAECDRLGKANDEACDSISTLQERIRVIDSCLTEKMEYINVLESRPVLTWEECLDEWENMNGRFDHIHHYLDWLKPRLPAPTDSIRVPFSDEAIEAMAKAGFEKMHPSSKWECADRDFYSAGIRAALAAGGLEPCAVPEYKPEDVALRPERASDEELKALAIDAYNEGPDVGYGKAMLRAAAAVRARVEAPLLAEIGRLDIENRDRAFYVEQFAAVFQERDTLKARIAELEALVKSQRSRISQLTHGMAEERKANTKLLANIEQLKEWNAEALEENNRLDAEADAARQYAHTMDLQNADYGRVVRELARVKAESLRVVPDPGGDEWVMTPDGLGWYGTDEYGNPSIETPHGYHHLEDCQPVRLERWETEE